MSIQLGTPPFSERQRVITQIVQLRQDQTGCFVLKDKESGEVHSLEVGVPIKELCRDQSLPIGVIAKRVLDHLVESTEKLGNPGKNYEAAFELKPAGVVFKWCFSYP